MIAENILKMAPEFRETFQSAKPFRHLCIDNFFEVEAAEKALSEFPAFDPAMAVNEHGLPGGKAVVSNLSEISPFYAQLYSYLFSREFLDAISALTGIPDLIGDPTLYGGGTHENLHGEDLYPHVDFNYIAGGTAHRRLNLLIYLNKNWDSAWGGDIEVHSNPRAPQTNYVKSYRVDFNRAVLFETNERSWHGFPRINLPEELRGKVSRKCISIYLYSTSRPEDEIAGRHGTFYVHRPLSERFAPGHVLSQDDVAEIRAGYDGRDKHIEAYQLREAELEQERWHQDHVGMNRLRRSWLYGAFWTLAKWEEKLRRLPPVTK